METARQLVERTEHLLAQVETLQSLVRQLSGELAAHAATLRDQLAEQRHHDAIAQRLSDSLIGDETPAPDRVEHILSAAAQIRFRERRATPRRRGNLVPVVLADADLSGEPIDGWVLDRSPGGLGILVDEEVPVGTVLNVRPAKCPVKVRGIRIEVRSCRPQHNNWNLGCQFLQKVSWNELRLFG